MNDAGQLSTLALVGVGFGVFISVLWREEIRNCSPENFFLVFKLSSIVCGLIGFVGLVTDDRVLSFRIFGLAVWTTSTVLTIWFIYDHFVLNKEEEEIPEPTPAPMTVSEPPPPPYVEPQKTADEKIKEILEKNRK